MNSFIIDASIAVKWVVEEEGTPEALTLRRRAKLRHPVPTAKAGTMKFIAAPEGHIRTATLEELVPRHRKPLPR